MTPLRQRMLEDMQMRNLSRGTQMVYVRAVMQLARHYHKSPDQLQREDIRGYLVYLAQQRRVAPSTYSARDGTLSGRRDRDQVLRVSSQVQKWVQKLSDSLDLS